MDFSKLQQLTEQILEQSKSIDKQRGAQRNPLFDQHLFTCNSKLMVPCIMETIGLIKSLVTEHQTGVLNSQRANYLGEKITLQIGALQREIKTQSIRRNEPKKRTAWFRPINELYQDLAQHQDWERRLKTMVRDKQAQLDLSHTHHQVDYQARQKLQKSYCT